MAVGNSTGTSSPRPENKLAELLPEQSRPVGNYMRLIDLEAETGKWLYVTIDDEKDEATGFLAD